MGILVVKIATLILGGLSIFLLFYKEEDIEKSNFIFAFMTCYVFAMTYINYTMTGTELYSKKAMILFLALLAVVANFIKVKCYIVSRVLMNLAILMNLYFLFT
ncbi:hypothetical protein [Clostridium massiliamazoniense]|uniref:hypothetical protein n=1 Tax=Clostridium massiliamazoniense TaxID=1347366 RepID=UPI0006D777FC|nr:hypothetical protein [Clostridium massiliamazoniense]